jgi:hypothetical protein
MLESLVGAYRFSNLIFIEIDASTAAAASQALLGSIAGITLIFSFCGMSSPQALWMSMNQYQLILLILLIGGHIPQSIILYLSSMKMTTCSFNFIPFKDIPCLKILIDWMDFSFEFKELDHFGIFSGSTFVNNFSLVCILAIIFIVDLCFSAVYKKYPSPLKREKWFQKVYYKIYEIFKGVIYVRLLLEAYQFLIISCLSEIYNVEFGKSNESVSFLLAILGVVF